MKLSKLIENIKYLRLNNFADSQVLGISYNSKTVKSGDIFICQKGEHVDSHNFYQDAINNGAVAFFCEHELECDLPQIIVENPAQQIGSLASRFYNNPTKDMNLIGVTGTNGKTTVTHLIQKIIEDANQKCGIIGTLGYKLSSTDSYKNEDRTTPQPSDLQQTFSDIKNADVDNVIMEVSSHALSQNRVGGCSFKGAVFTNLTQDHLDYHKTMEEYFKAKAILPSIIDNGFVVSNIDASHGQRFLETAKEGVKKYTYGIHKEADFRATNVEYSNQGASFLLNDKHQVKLKMCGEFSVYNSLAALATTFAMGISLDDSIKSLEATYGVAGRFEVVAKEPLVIVDYAHTPDGLENALTAAKNITSPDAKLICVFGCGGDRDTTKRPIMAQIAEKLADFVIITSDNPRTEDPQKIITDVLAGIKDNAIVEPDREQAIAKAKEVTNKNDVVLLAGKGHEEYQILSTGKIHFSDKETAIKYFR